MPLELRPAALADAAAVALLMNTAYRGAGDKQGWTTENAYIEGNRTSERLLRDEMLAKPHGVLLLAGRPTPPFNACVWLEACSDLVWYLGSLTVHPDRQNSGLGRELLTAAECWVQQKGAHTVRITVVNLRTTLIAWYERRGYRRTGEVLPFPYGDGRFGRPLRSDLSFVVLEKQLSDPSTANSASSSGNPEG